MLGSDYTEARVYTLVRKLSPSVRPEEVLKLAPKPFLVERFEIAPGARGKIVERRLPRGKSRIVEDPRHRSGIDLIAENPSDMMERRAKNRQPACARISTRQCSLL